MSTRRVEWTTKDRQGPLNGLRVLEAANLYAGPFLGRVLQDFGADVIKIENPPGGDPARLWPPMRDGMSVNFMRLNVDKRSVFCDLRTEEGSAATRSLAEQADVMIEGFRPGMMANWGLGHDTLAAVNQKLITVHISGYGQTGPYRERPGFGTVAEAFSGFTHLNGWPETPPTSAPFGLTDQIAGLAGVIGTLLALRERDRTGRGDEVDVALYEPLLALMGDAVLRYSGVGVIPQRWGNAGDKTSPRGVFRTADDSWVVIAGSSQNVVARLFEAMDMPELIEDARFETNEARLAHDEELKKIVSDWTESLPRNELVARLDAFQVVAAPVFDAKDVSEDPHIRERGMVVDCNLENVGEIMMSGPITRLASFGFDDFTSVPLPGQHTDSLLGPRVDG